jgi:hypothetical protein
MLKRLVSTLFVASLALSLNLEAHFPQIGQIIRFQPMLKRNSGDFVAAGHIEVQGSRIPYEVAWYSGKDYVVTLENVPSYFYSPSGSQSGSWKLQRKNDECLLQAGRKTVTCGPALFWALLEVGAQTNEVASALRQTGFISDSEATYTETNSRDPNTELGTQKKRPELVVSHFGPNPKAVLQIRNLKFEDSDSARAQLLEFEQTHLLPVRARFAWNDALVSYEATIGQWGKKENSRNRPLMSTRLKVFKGKELLASVDRKLSEGVSPPSSRVPLRDAQQPLDSLREELSPQGQRLLDFLILSH